MHLEKRGLKLPSATCGRWLHTLKASTSKLHPLFLPANGELHDSLTPSVRAAVGPLFRGRFSDPGEGKLCFPESYKVGGGRGICRAMQPVADSTLVVVLSSTLRVELPGVIFASDREGPGGVIIVIKYPKPTKTPKIAASCISRRHRNTTTAAAPPPTAVVRIQIERHPNRVTYTRGRLQMD